MPQSALLLHQSTSRSPYTWRGNTVRVLSAMLGQQEGRPTELEGVESTPSLTVLTNSSFAQTQQYYSQDPGLSQSYQTGSMTAQFSTLIPE